LSAPNVSPYTHAIFSDFSGDDGFKFDSGSSKCLTLAWVATAEEDVDHNEDVLFRIKKKVGCHFSDELKYRSIKSHPANKDETLNLLQELKADVSCLVVFKKPLFKDEEEDEEEDSYYADPKTKGLVVVMQSFPFSGLMRDLEAKYGKVRPRIVVDELHWKETQNRIIEVMSENSKEWFNRSDFQFRSSRATPLLQIADLFCGAVREFCEGLEGHEVPPCHVCNSHDYLPRDCKWRRSGARPKGFRIMRAIYPLMLGPPGKSYRIPHGLYLLPKRMNVRLEFVDCLLGGK